MPKLIVIAGMVVASAVAAAAGPSSGGRSAGMLRAGSGADSIVTGYFNHDRKLDLAVANRDANTISVFFGRGNGRFGPAHVFATGPDPRSLRAADVNGDGALDLLTANAGNNTVSVLPGNGHFSFLPHVDVSTCASCRPLAIEAGDFNGDTHVDVAVASVGSNQISMLLGNGDGTFSRIDAAGFVRDDPQWLESGDFNSDGMLDLATANLDTVAVSTLQGTGNGTFRTGPEYSTGSVSFGLAVADVNKDGFLDLVVANQALVTSSTVFGRDGVSVFLGDGTGHFTHGPDLEAGAQPRSVAVADFNQDGRRDLAVANFGSDTVTIFFGGARGTFMRADLTTGDGPAAMATGNFNGDQRSDLAVTSRNDGAVSVFLSIRRQ
jgi:hypothetical protein